MKAFLLPGSSPIPTDLLQNHHTLQVLMLITFASLVARRKLKVAICFNCLMSSAGQGSSISVGYCRMPINRMPTLFPLYVS